MAKAADEGVLEGCWRWNIEVFQEKSINGFPVRMRYSMGKFYFGLMQYEML